MTSLHFVEADFGRDIGCAFVERDSNEMDRKTTIRMIMAGEWNKVLRVLEVNPEEGSCRDVSEDIAIEIANIAQRDPISYELLTFIENHAGLALGRELVREDA